MLVGFLPGDEAVAGSQPFALAQIAGAGLMQAHVGYASRRALNRQALYQAKARAFGTVRFLRNIRQRLGNAPLAPTDVPGHLVRDIGLPAFSHR